MNIELMMLDLASLESTKKFTEDFKQKNLPLHMLICNAGVFMVPHGKAMTSCSYYESIVWYCGNNYYYYYVAGVELNWQLAKYGNSPIFNPYTKFLYIKCCVVCDTIIKSTIFIVYGGILPNCYRTVLHVMFTRCVQSFVNFVCDK